MLYSIFAAVYRSWYGLAAGLGLPETLISVIGILAVTMVVLVFMLCLCLFLVYLERKVAGHIQHRYGPMRVGPHGVLQTIADAIKILLKEDIVPRKADYLLHLLSPGIVFLACFMAFLILPFGERLQVKDLDIGILYVFAVSSFAVIGIVLAGWSSNNKWSMLGGLRAAAQMISYEVPLVLSLLVVVMYTGSLKLGSVVQYQQEHGWFVTSLPGMIGLVIYLVAATAEVNRTPFDLPEAESELVAGYNTEYSGMKFALFFLAEFLNMFVACAIAVTFFLGGWDMFGLPFIHGTLAFMLKTLAVVLLMMWFRWTFPRLRVDRLMEFGWKFLMPVAFANILLAGFIIKWAEIIK